MHLFFWKHKDLCSEKRFIATARHRIRYAAQKCRALDGFVIVYPMALQALKSLPHVPPLPRENNGEIRLMKFFKEICEREQAPTLDALLPHFQNLCRAASVRLSESEAQLFLPLCVLFSFFRYCCADTSDGAREQYMRFLFTLRYTQFEEIYQFLSPVEKCLRRDPTENYLKADADTKMLYRRRLYRYARRHHLSREAAAELLVDRAYGEGTDQSEDIGTILMQYGNADCRVWSVILQWCIGILFACVFLILSFLMKTVLPLFCLVLVPFLTEPLVYRLLAKRYGADILPRYELSCIPKEGRTLCVVATIASSTDVAQDIRRLEDNYLRNREEECRFGVLIDLPESKTFGDQTDVRILAWQKGIAELSEKYQTDFYLFFRAPVYNPMERIYMGWERKRGALIQLSEFLLATQNHEKQKHETIKVLCGGSDFLYGIKYLMTLDADTEVGYGDIKKLVATALFPTNRAKTDALKTCVVSGYGVFQPNVVPTLASVMATPFSKRSEGFGGNRVYHTAEFSLHMAQEGIGIFCGKGLLDLTIFACIMPNAFDENRILSHDFLEGALLRCGYVGDVDLSDAVPSNILSQQKRQMRWIRGDVQSVGLVRGVNAKYLRVVLRKNIASELFPTFVFLLCTILLYLRPWTAVLPLVLYIFPKLLAATEISIRSQSARRLYGAVFHPLSRTIFSALADIMTLPYTAFCAAVAAIKGWYRAHVSHRHCLQWATAGETERHMGKKGSLRYFVLTMFPCLLAAAVFIVTKSPVGCFLGTLFLSAPLVEFVYSRPCKTQQDATISSQNQREALLDTAKHTWAYYEQIVGKDSNFLPPDNLQMIPTPRVARITSPTNVGMYLLSILGAWYLRLIDHHTLETRITNALDTIERLPKWNGHLYNWFDTATLQVRGTPYISLVDSGNYLAALIILRQHFYVLGQREDLQTRLETIANNTDLSCFYRKESKLFAIGYFPRTDTFTDNDFDLYMSEARTASYIAVARGEVPAEHWETLSRVISELDRHFGMLSWTGTTFEYFMPQLWFSAAPGSFLYESLRFAQHQQILDRCLKKDRVYGISESAYDMFDHLKNYQYHACGVPALAIAGAQENGRVVSPYSTFLMAQFGGGHTFHRHLDNLRQLRKHGVYDDFGYYDALDCNSTVPHPVQNYMSHHQGMILCAICNLLCNRPFEKAFYADPQMRAGHVLLEEQIPYFAPGRHLDR